MVSDLEVAAEGLRINLKAALEFDNQATAEDTLLALRARENILAACVYRREPLEDQPEVLGPFKVFAKYQHPGVTEPFVPPQEPGETRFADDSLYVVQSFVINED